jgi:hypothetical protein
MAEAPSASPESRASIETLLARIVARLDSMDARLDSIEKRFEGRLDAIEKGFDGRLDRIEKRSNVLIGLWAAVIVVLITTDGLMWNAIVTGERGLRQKITQLGDGLDGRITDLERRLVERIHNLELAFVRSGITLQPGGPPLPQGRDEQRSEREVSPGAGPAEPETPPDRAE